RRRPPRRRPQRKRQARKRLQRKPAVRKPQRKRLLRRKPPRRRPARRRQLGRRPRGRRHLRAKAPSSGVIRAEFRLTNEVPAKAGTFFWSEEVKQNEQKRQAAQAALAYIKDGITLGVGTG